MVIGRHDLDNNEGVKIRMEEEIEHPDYNWKNTDNDFMLVVLKDPVDLNDGDVELVNVNSQSSAPGEGDEVRVMG